MNYLKTLGLIVISILIFIVLAATASFKMQSIKVTPVEPDGAQAISNEKMASGAITESVPPPPPITLPCEGVVIPCSAAYVLEDNKAVVKGHMKDEYLGCKVLKSVAVDGKDYYYAQVTHEGYKQDYYLYTKDSIVFFMEDNNLAVLPELK